MKNPPLPKNVWGTKMNKNLPFPSLSMCTCTRLIRTYCTGHHNERLGKMTIRIVWRQDRHVSIASSSLHWIGSDSTPATVTGTDGCMLFYRHQTNNAKIGCHRSKSVIISTLVILWNYTDITTKYSYTKLVCLLFNLSTIQYSQREMLKIVTSENIFS